MRRWLWAMVVALSSGTGTAQPIAGTEVVALVRQAMAEAGQPAAEIAVPIRAFPACDHAPRVSPRGGNWAMVELRCEAPAEWQRMVRTAAPPLATRTVAGPGNDAPTGLQPVLVATRPLARGERLGPGDLRLADTATGSRLGVLTDIARAEGRRLKVSLMPDQPILERHLEPAFHVAEGEAVVLHLVTAGIEIGISARALENGWTGDRITVQPWNSDRTVPARVIGPGILQAMPNILPQAAVHR